MFRRSRIIGLGLVALAIITIALLIGFGCAKKTGPEKILVGSILPLSGDDAQWGEQERKGIMLGIEALDPNTRNNVEVVFFDHQGKSESALDALKQMKSRGIHYCADIMSSGIALSTANYFNENKILVLSGSDTLGALTQKGGSFFYRVIPSDALAARGLAKWAAKKGWNRSVVVYDISDWGQGLKEELDKSLKDSRGVVLDSLQTKEGANDFSAVVASVKKYNPDAVYLLTYPREAALIAKELGSVKSGPVLLGTDNFTSPVLVEASNMQLDRVYYVVPKEAATQENPEYKKLTEQYQKTTGNKEELPPLFLVYGYDLIRILANVAKTAGNDTEKARSLLDKMEFAGASGKISFDENGDLKKEIEYGLMRFAVEGGKKNKVVKRIPAE